LNSQQLNFPFSIHYLEVQEITYYLITYYIFKVLLLAKNLNNIGYFNEITYYIQVTQIAKILCKKKKIIDGVN
jgi:hypothetical protein